jgi:hypothetical protein
MVDQAVQKKAATICYRCAEVGHEVQNCKRRKRRKVLLVRWSGRTGTSHPFDLSI